jgi:hypothetical protein
MNISVIFLQVKILGMYRAEILRNLSKRIYCIITYCSDFSALLVCSILGHSFWLHLYFAPFCWFIYLLYFCVFPCFLRHLIKFLLNEQRTEVYEYARVLGNSQYILLPFQPYKLIYAYMLAEIGKVSDSLR